jgi:hypothetical protein
MSYLNSKMIGTQFFFVTIDQKCFLIVFHLITLPPKWGAIYSFKSLWDLKNEIISLHFTDFTLVTAISL